MEVVQLFCFNLCPLLGFGGWMGGLFIHFLKFAPLLIFPDIYFLRYLDLDSYVVVANTVCNHAWVTCMLTEILWRLPVLPEDCEAYAVHKVCISWQLAQYSWHSQSHCWVTTGILSPTAKWQLAFLVPLLGDNWHSKSHCWVTTGILSPTARWQLAFIIPLLGDNWHSQSHC